MSVVMCNRCGKFVDLDFNVEDVVVAQNGIDWLCLDCLTDDEQTTLEKADYNPEALITSQKGQT